MLSLYPGPNIADAAESCKTFTIGFVIGFDPNNDNDPTTPTLMAPVNCWGMGVVGGPHQRRSPHQATPALIGLLGLSGAVLVSWDYTH